MGLSTLLHLSFFLAMITALHAQPGFISIDCGLESDRSYTDMATGIVYSSDAGFVNSGINVVVPSRPAIENKFIRFLTMRSFPNGTRNCYTITPITAGAKYLIRASFLYGDYDGKNQPPVFDIYFGVNQWQRIETLSDDIVYAEIIVTPPYDKMQVCFVNIGFGMPFVSALEVRPFLRTMYPQVNQTHSFVLIFKRVDFGSSDIIRYPRDPYDRLWYGTFMRTGWKAVTQEGNISRPGDDILQVPPDVLRTAIIANNLEYNISIDPGERVHLFMSFTELRRLNTNDTREFDIYYNEKLLYAHYRPSYMTMGILQASQMGRETTFFLTLKATANSTLPPMINAFEAYGLREMTLSTNPKDDSTITKIRDLYRLTKNWQGDPCGPQNFYWEGVGCKVSVTENSRIISLNLSSSMLLGDLSPLFADLSSLDMLDLSGNNLTGQIPSELGNLPSLHTLILNNNKLSGAIPRALYEKSQSGSLKLKIDGNLGLCNKPDSCVTPASHKKVILISVISGALVICGAGVAFLLYMFKKRRDKKTQTNPVDSRENVISQVNQKPQGPYSDRDKFSFEEVVKITRNFERKIGRGGFGIVYHGILDDGTEVAVKMILRSPRGAKEFEAEAGILTRVHHKNLVSLIGYCNENSNLVLIYEYMQRGSLADVLSGNGGDSITLNWSMRLKIALDVAQGLDYLHNFCKPVVVHRDVKSGNILLNEKLEAKIGDFGLSRTFSAESDTHISTAVAGTPGYLDPEYYQTYRLTETSDVYSFGVVLWEIVSGRPPISRDPEDNQILPWLMSRVEIGDMSSLADTRLRGEYDKKCMLKVVEVAMACISPESWSRPTMSKVVMQLKECYESVPSNEVSSLSPQMSTSTDVISSEFSSA